MLLLRADHVRKNYGDRTVLEVESLSIYTNDRIGVVGKNGAGKTTLFELLAGQLEPDAGTVRRFGEISYCRQLQEGQVAGHMQNVQAKRWHVPAREDMSAFSGGEEMRQKLAEAFSGESHILLLDEPTANLDREGIDKLIGQLKKAETFLCISHDRELLNAVCTQIAEVENGKITLYPGNYRDYEAFKEKERQTALREYEEYRQEKGRLEAVYRNKRESAQRMVKIPKGMSPREAHLQDFLAVGRNSSGKQKSMNRAADNVRKRLEHMEVKEKPQQEVEMHLCFERTDPPKSRRILEAKQLCFAYGTRPLFHDASFCVSNRKKTAVLGENGVGKTTLFRLIEKAQREGADGIRMTPKAKVGVLRQDFSGLLPHKTVLENAMAQSVQDMAIVKNVLAGLLFFADDWNKKAGILSGGEKMKLSFAALLVSDANVLLLDEPTNYLDLPSIRALEKQLAAYDGAVLFTSHDREFVKNTAQELLVIKDCNIQRICATLQEYEGECQKGERKPQNRQERISKEERMRLELRLANLTGRLGHAPSLDEKERLEAEYWGIVEKLRVNSHTH